MKVRQLVLRKDESIQMEEFLDSGEAMYPHIVEEALSDRFVRSVQIHFHDGSSVLTTTERA